MTTRGVSFCRGCDSTSLFLALDLGKSPLANSLASTRGAPLKKFPLQLMVCENCSLGQVGEFETPEQIFTDYPYLSSTSDTWLEANKQFAKDLVQSQNLVIGDLIVELASNDGYLLKFFQATGQEVLGVEPAQNVAEIANREGVPTLPEFFSLSMAQRLSITHPAPKVIVAKNVVAHVPDIQDFISGIAELSGPETLIVIEAPTISQIITGLQFDTVYHEHFSYLSATSLNHIFASKGLEIVGVEKVDTHGGSLRFFAKKIDALVVVTESQRDALSQIIKLEESIGVKDPEEWAKVSSRMNNCLTSFGDWLTKKDLGVKTVAYGAAAKGVTLMSALNLEPGLIDFVIDNSPAKTGKYMPVIDVLIVDEFDFVRARPKGRYRYVIFPWNLSGEIVRRIRKFDPAAEVVTAIPTLERVE